MNNEKVSALAQAFAKSWNERFSKYPRYSLDFSWPSVGTIDLALGGLCGKKSLTEAEDSLLRSATAYLAHIAYQCWKSFPGHPEVSLRLIEEPHFEIELEAKGGRCLDAGQSFTVPLYSSLRDLLQTPPSVCPTLEKGVRLLAPGGNILSPVMAGVLGGLTPLGTGPWNGLSTEAFSLELYASCEWMARSSAEHYHKLFPSEERGASWEFYRSYLVLPPLGFDEPALGIRASGGLYEMLQAGESSAEEMLEVALNLCSLRDDLLSAAGFVLAACCATGELPLKLQAAAENRGFSAAEFRSAVLFLRKRMGSHESWFEALSLGEEAESLRLLKWERELGLLPFLGIAEIGGKSDLFLELFELLSWAQPKQVRDIVALRCPVDSLPTDVILELASIDLFCGELDLARRRLDSLKEKLSMERAGEVFQFFRLTSQLHRLEGDLEQEFQALERAFSVGTDKSQHLAEVGLRFALLLYAEGKKELAFSILEKSLEECSWSAQLGAVRYSLLRDFGTDEQAAEQLQKLVFLAPSSVQVFQLVSEQILGINAA